MIAYILRGMLLAGLVTLAGGAFAAPVPTGGQWDKFNISLGGFTSRTSSSIQLNNTQHGCRRKRRSRRYAGCGIEIRHRQDRYTLSLGAGLTGTRSSSTISIMIATGFAR